MSERKSFLLRMNPDLWNDLARWAAEELRSVNGQIEFILRRAVDEKFGPGGARKATRHRSRPREDG